MNPFNIYYGYYDEFDYYIDFIRSIKIIKEIKNRFYFGNNAIVSAISKYLKLIVPRCRSPGS